MLQARDTRREGLGSEIWVSRSGQLPVVGELQDPVALGVHPAAGSGPSRAGRVPLFVQRTITGELLQALRQARFVVLVGESTAGKSRAAYELVQSELPGYRLVVPLRRESALTAAEVAAVTPRCVLWLDDLERFLGAGGLTGAAVRQVLEARGTERFIVATMRSEEYAGFSGRSSAGLASAGREVMRQGWDVLRLAVYVEIPRRWSPEDVARARQAGDDQRMTEAVHHAAEYGIAEYLAAAPQLLEEWHHAWAPGTHPRAAAMVLAAVDARRAGIHRPLPLPLLVQMHQPYLDQRGGQRLRPESPDDALAWATEPLFATSSLLMPAGGGYLAFDYLIDALSRDRVPGAALESMIAFATPNEVIDVGRLARNWSLPGQADSAFRRAEAAGLFEGTSYRCWLIRQEQGLPAALRFAQDALKMTAATYGPDDPQTFKARFLAACEAGNSGDEAAARQLLGKLAADAARVLGAGHRQTLEARDGAVQFTDEADPRAALHLCEELARDCARILGDGDELTISCRERAGFWTHKTGDHARAAQVFKALLTDMTGQFRAPEPDTVWIRAEMAECQAEAGDLPAAVTEWECTIRDAGKSYGRLDSTTLELKRRYAQCLGEAGDPAGAVTLLAALLAETAELSDDDLCLILQIRESLAWWTGIAGHPAAAHRDLTALLPAAQKRGSHDLSLKKLEHMVSYWAAMTGPDGEVLSLLRRVIDQAAHDLGPDNLITRKARQDIDARHPIPMAGDIES
jgi:hypothetical protein